MRTALWRPPQTAGTEYLWQYLTYHLEGGLDHELDELCCDLRFIATRLLRSSPAAVEVEMARSGTPLAVRLRRAVAQNAHILGPIDPPAALVTTLISRLGVVPEVARQLDNVRSELAAWRAWQD